MAVGHLSALSSTIRRWTMSGGLAATLLMVAVFPSRPGAEPFAPSAAVANVAEPAVARSQIALEAAPLAKGTLSQRTFKSTIIGKDEPYMIYEPAGMKASDRLPVLYFLHGLAADCSQWVGIGVVEAADSLIASGEIPPMIIVMPSGENGYWMNHRPTGPAYRDYLINEFIPAIERFEPIDGQRQSRAIGGLSAGGHGAMVLAWSNPELFSVIGAHSPGLRDQATSLPFFGTGDEFAKRDPISIAAKLTSSDFDLWIDTGDSDPWRQRADQLHQILTSRAIPHRWQTSAGGHDGVYWSKNLTTYLRFYGTSLAKRRAMAAGVIDGSILTAN